MVYSLIHSFTSRQLPDVLEQTSPDDWIRITAIEVAGRPPIPALAGFVSPQSIAPDGRETSRRPALTQFAFYGAGCGVVFAA